MPTAAANRSASSRVSEPGPQPTSSSRPGPVEVQLGGDPVGQLGRVGHPADDVVRGGAGVQVRVALPGTRQCRSPSEAGRSGSITAWTPTSSSSAAGLPAWSPRTSWPSAGPLGDRCSTGNRCDSLGGQALLVPRRAVPASTPPSSGGCGSRTRRSWPWPTGWAAPRFDRPRTTGRAAGPRPTCTSRPVRSAAWLHELGVRWFPLVQWAERGGYSAAGHGNSVPRFHVTWGTGPGLVEPFVAAGAARRRRVRIRARHRVTALEVGDGRRTRCHGRGPGAQRAARGVRSPDAVVGEF